MLEGHTTSPKPTKFLLAEDDDDHAKIVSRTLTHDGMTNTIDRVHNGVEALEYLKRVEKSKDGVLPDIILLDLNLPKKDGLEVLAEVKSNPRFRPIPVVILTTSDAEKDKVNAYQNYANSYLVKPLDPGSFIKMIEDLHVYWGGWNRTLTKDKGMNLSKKV